MPKAVVADFQGEYFDVTKKNGRIVPTHVRLARADAVRAKLTELGMSEAGVWPKPWHGPVELHDRVALIGCFGWVRPMGC